MKSRTQIILGASFIWDMRPRRGHFKGWVAGILAVKGSDHKKNAARSPGMSQITPEGGGAGGVGVRFHARIFLKVPTNLTQLFYYSHRPRTGAYWRFNPGGRNKSPSSSINTFKKRYRSPLATYYKTPPYLQL